MKSYRKPYRVKRKKPALRSRLLWFMVLAAIIAGAILYFLFFSDFFLIKKIKINGQNTVSEIDIQSAVPGGNILLINIPKIKKDILSSFPMVAMAEVRRVLPDTLDIKITERLAAAAWCQERCFLIDENGIVFDMALPETNLIRISGERELLSGEMVNRIIELKVKLKEKSGIDATKAFVTSQDRLNLQTSDGWKIYFNPKGDLDWQIQEFALVLEKQIPPEKIKNLEYIDLRFSRVYYKYK
jgi:cell division protein FtsQ